MKIIKVDNELREVALEHLYKDIVYNWSNNVDHLVTMTEVIHEDDTCQRFRSSIRVEKPKSSEHFYIICNKIGQESRYPISDLEDFKCTYMLMLNNIKSANEEDLIV